MKAEGLELEAGSWNLEAQAVIISEVLSFEL